MGTDPDPDTERVQSSASGSLSRRRVLRTAGFGAGLAALGGASVVAAQDDDDGDDPGTENGDDADDGNGDDEEDDGDDSPFVDDLIDPVFGYPLDAEETGQVDIDTVVQLVTQGGPGDHAGFPAEGGEEVPAEFIFDPVGLAVEPGDVVHFFDASGLHTVTAFSDKYADAEGPLPTRVPDGTPGFSSPPLVADESWLYQFEESGVYDLLCLPHLGLGMVMRVVVFDPETDDMESEGFAPPEAGPVPPNAQAVLTDDALAPANIVEAGQVAWADLDLGSGEAPETPGTDDSPEGTPGDDGEQ
jgi:plastocyanin